MVDAEVVGPALSMASSIARHDSFFCRVLDMLPRHLYDHLHSTDNIPEDEIKYHKHRKLAMTADEKKEKSKRERSMKYDPTQHKPLAHLRTEEHKRFKEENDVTPNTPTEDTQPLEDVDEIQNANSIEMLRQRLRDKILAKRSSRTAKDGASTVANKAREIGSTGTGVGSATALSRKRKFEEPQGSGAYEKEKKNRAKDIHGKHTRVPSNYKTGGGAQLEVQPPPPSYVLEGSNNEDIDITYSGLNDGTNIVRVEEGKPGSKMKRLQTMLKQAEAKHRQLEQLKLSEHEEDKHKYNDTLWKDAARNAAGEVVHDDPKRLKKTLKRKVKSKEKSAKEWSARLESVAADKAQRQSKRNENLSKKRQRGFSTGNSNTRGPKTEGGANKKAAQTNETSSRPRAGFEGKKTDFLNSKDKK